MNPEIAALLNYKYNRENGPLTPLETAEKDGINCQWAVHEFYRKKFGIELPKGLWSKELLEDNREFFINLNGKPLVMGDVLMVSRRPNAKPEKLHLGIYLGEGDQIIHANSFDGRVSVWPMTEFSNKYPIRWVTKRLKPELFNVLIKPHI